MLGVRENTAIVPKPLIGSAHIPAEIHLGIYYGCDQMVSSLRKSSGPTRLSLPLPSLHISDFYEFFFLACCES